jgi:DNA-binding NarL/FixJ family response regulator
MLSFLNDHSTITRMMEMGANSYLTKDSDSETIYQAIKTCHADDFFFNDLTNKALLNGLRNKRAPEPEPAEVHLSDKEITILRLMCEEKSTKEIRRHCGPEPAYGRSHPDKLKSKTGTKSMAGLVLYAIKAGIVVQA